MGSGPSMQVQQPQAPTPQQDVQAWEQSLPGIYQAQAQYAPQEAQQQVQIAQQTDLPLAQAAQQAQQALYPQVASLNENLATIANQNMSGNVPDWMKQQYQSNMNAQLGNNAPSGIGSDYMSRGLMQQNQNWQQYYQGLGSSVAAGMPMVQPQSAGYSNYMSGFTPGGVMTGQNQNYGTSANLYGNMYNTNSQYQQGMLGAALGAVGGGAQAFGQGGGVAGISKLLMP